MVANHDDTASSGVPVTSLNHPHAREPHRGLRAVWQARELLWSFARRDLTVRYRNALLGIGWAVLSPVGQMAIFSLIFTRVVRIETSVPYPLFAFCGLAAWNFTAAALRGAVTSLSGNAVLVTKVAFRREVLPLAVVVVAAVDFAVSLGVVAAMLWYYGVPLRWTVLLLPVVATMQCVFTAGLALLLAAANLLWRDVRHVFEVGITLWMFATSVLYPMPPMSGWLGVTLGLNPMTPIIDAYRDILLRGTLPDLRIMALTAMCSLVTLIGGVFIFQRAAPRFAELA